MMKYLLMAGLTCFLFACKKEETPVRKNNESPEVEMLAPKYDHMMFAYNDTLRIKANLTDDAEIAQVEVTLGKVGSTVPELNFQKKVNKASFYLDTFFVFQSASMADFILKIKAVDHQNAVMDVQRQMMQH